MLVPLRAVPNQTAIFIIGEQNLQCQLNVYQKAIGMFLDLYVEESNVLAGVLCRNLTPLVINSYFGFPGDLMFVDNLKLNADPIYTGLGSRWFLIYMNSVDAAALDLSPVFI